MNGAVAGRPARLLLGQGFRGAGLAALGLGFGVAVTAAATRVGGDNAPVALLALAVAPAVILAVIARPLVGVSVVLLTFPIGSLQLPSLPLGPVQLPNTQTVEVTALVVAVLVVLRRLARAERPLPWAGAMGWATALFAWAVVGTPSAVDLSLAFKQVAMLGAGIVFALVVLAALENMDDVRRMLGVLLAVASGIAIVALSQGFRFQSSLSGETVGGRLKGAFDHPNQLGLFCAISASIAAGLAFGAHTRLARVASAGALGLVLVPLVLSLSRGAWIGCGLAFLFLLVALREARRALLLVGIPLIAVASAVGSFAPGKTDIHIVGQRARAITTLSPYDGRKAIYKEAEREIKARPLVGYGPGSFPVASVQSGSQALTIYADHAHDLWLTWGAEDGLPAVAIVIGLMIGLAVAGRQAARGAKAAVAHRDRAVIAGMCAALLAVVGQGLFDYLLRNAVLWILVWGIVGALLVSAREYGGVPRPGR